MATAAVLTRRVILAVLLPMRTRLVAACRMRVAMPMMLVVVLVVVVVLARRGIGVPRMPTVLVPLMRSLR